MMILFFSPRLCLLLFFVIVVSLNYLFFPLISRPTLNEQVNFTLLLVTGRRDCWSLMCTQCFCVLPTLSICLPKQIHTRLHVTCLYVMFIFFLFRSSLTSDSTAYTHLCLRLCVCVSRSFSLSFLSTDFFSFPAIFSLFLLFASSSAFFFYSLPLLDLCYFEFEFHLFLSSLYNFTLSQHTVCYMICSLSLSLTQRQE